DRREQLQPRFLRPAIDYARSYQDILDVGLGVFDEDVEITITIEHARVEKFVFHVIASPAARLLYELFLWKSGLRIFVQEFHVRMSRRRIEIEVILLYVLSVVALRPGQSEQPLLQKRIATVPQRDGETDQLMPVADAGDAIFVPSVSPRPRVIVREA